MKKKMSSLDIKFCVEELQELLSSWTDKIYEIDGTFLIKFHHPEEGRKELIIEPGKRIHLTKMKYPTPKKPPDFPMLLRKHLSNYRLTKVKQPDLERIVELVFEKKDEEKILIAELFGAGNLVLCDKNYEIIQPYQREDWGTRTIRPNEKYDYPPKKGIDIRSIKKSDLKKIISKSPDVVRGLAKNLNIGGTVAEEICARAEINKEKSSDLISESEFNDLISSINEILEESLNPNIVMKDEKPLTVLPFEFHIFSENEINYFGRFNQALDNYFSEGVVREKSREEEAELEKELEKIRTKLENQKNHLEELKEKAPKVKKKADAISTHHKAIDGVLDKLKELRKSSGWEAAKEIVDEAKSSSEEWAKYIKSIHPNDGTIKMDLPEALVSIDLRDSAFENASNLYDRYKRIESKIDGAKEAIERTREELEETKIKGPSTVSKPKPREPRKRKWFERYRWFKSTDDFLVIGGRDVKTNQEVVEKHMEPQDLYFHTDIQGAPHVIIKTEGRAVPKETIGEAARFAAIHSSAWREGLGNMDVYWADPEQVTKNAPSGEYLPKGSYMVEGEREYKTVLLEAGVGLIEVNDEKIPMCGPPSAVKAHSGKVVLIKPRGMKKSDLAQRIKEELEEVGIKIKINDLMRVLPPGEGKIID